MGVSTNHAVVMDDHDLGMPNFEKHPYVKMVDDWKLYRYIAI